MEPNPPRAQKIAAISPRLKKSRRAPALCSCSPARYPLRSRIPGASSTLKPARVIASTPALSCSSWTDPEGATTPIFSPLFSADGLSGTTKLLHSSNRKGPAANGVTCEQHSISGAPVPYPQGHNDLYIFSKKPRQHKKFLTFTST